jgi:hypothetical protein
MHIQLGKHQSHMPLQHLSAAAADNGSHPTGDRGMGHDNLQQPGGRGSSSISARRRRSYIAGQMHRRQVGGSKRPGTTNDLQQLSFSAQQHVQQLPSQQQPLPEQPDVVAQAEQLLHNTQHQQQQQYLLQQQYVSEPWDVPEPVEISEPWEMFTPNKSLPAQHQWQQQQQQHRQMSAVAGEPAPSDNAAVVVDNWFDTDNGSLDEVWLLDGASDSDQEEGGQLDKLKSTAAAGFYDVSLHAQSHARDGNVQDQPDSTRQQQQLKPQQQQQTLQSQQYSSSSSSSRSSRRPAAARSTPQAPTTTAAAASSGPAHPDLQASWEAAVGASLRLLASYDVRYDVPRPARLSSSISRRHGAARITATGVAGPPPAATVGSDVGIICLTAAAAAAKAKARRWHSQVRRVDECDGCLRTPHE